MKSIIKLTMIFALLYSVSATAQNSIFNDDEETFITTFLNPTFDDAGVQFGAGVLKEMLWGWAGAEISAYPELSVPYWDLVAQGGIALETGIFTNRYGLRLGRVDREGNPFGLVGGIMMFEFKITKGVRFNLRFWLDYREDQKDEFYGDSDAHTYLIFSNPLLQENGAAGFTIQLN